MQPFQGEDKEIKKLEHWEMNEGEVLWRGHLRFKGTLLYHKYIAVMSREPKLYLYRLEDKSLRVFFDLQRQHFQIDSEMKFRILPQKDQPSKVWHPLS